VSIPLLRKGGSGSWKR